MNLRAHMQRIQFIFRPKQHVLWFVSKDGTDRLGPSRAEIFFKKLLDDASIAHGGPQIEVTSIPDKAALDEMLAIPRLSKIVLQFKRPNADDASDVEDMIMERMETLNVAMMREELVATSGQSIKPDQKTRDEAAVAAKNGRVDVFGKDENGVAVEESTVNKPLRVPIKMNPNIETVLAALRRAWSPR